MSVLNAPPREGLIRAASGDMTLRAAGDGEPARLGGHFVVFDTWTEINSAWEGNFLERIAPGAARKTLREQGDNIKLLLEHGQDPTVGQKPLGRFTSLREDEVGVAYDADLYDAQYVRELLPALRDGMYGASFRFRVVREDVNEDPGVSDHNPKGLPERTIREMSIAEGGPVLWGAYPTATAQARSLTDEFAFRRFMDLSPEKLRTLADFWEARDARAEAVADEPAADEEERDEPTADERRAEPTTEALAEISATLDALEERAAEIAEAERLVLLDALRALNTELPATEVVEENAEPAPADESARRDEAPAAPPTTGTRKAPRSYTLNRKDGASWKLP